MEIIKASHTGTYIGLPKDCRQSIIMINRISAVFQPCSNKTLGKGKFEEQGSKARMGVKISPEVPVLFFHGIEM